MTTPYGQKVVTVTAVVVAAAAAVVNDDRNSRLCWKSLTFFYPPTLEDFVELVSCQQRDNIGLLLNDLAYQISNKICQIYVKPILKSGTLSTNCCGYFLGKVRKIGLLCIITSYQTGCQWLMLFSSHGRLVTLQSHSFLNKVWSKSLTLRAKLVLNFDLTVLLIYVRTRLR